MILLLVLLGCDRPFTEDDGRAIQLAAVRWLMDDRGDDGAFVACLEVETYISRREDAVSGGPCLGDAEEDRAFLLATFAAEGRTAVPVDECVLASETGEPLSYRWVQAETGAEAMVYEVGCAGEPTDGIVTIAASYARADLYEAGYTCTARWSGEDWEIESCDVDFMS